MRSDFPAAPRRQRVLFEAMFSAAKRNVSERATGRATHTQERQALLLGVAFNLNRLRLRLPLALLFP